MQRNERHKLIIDLIAKRKITRQEELATLLRDRGVEVTQASISRDLDDLGVIKLNGRYAKAPIGNGSSNVFGISVIEPAGDNMIVVRCSAGLASAAAVRIDAERITEIVGTIAGDDTIFIAVTDAAKQRAAMKKLRALFTTSEGR